MEGTQVSCIIQNKTNFHKVSSLANMSEYKYAIFLSKFIKIHLNSYFIIRARSLHISYVLSYVLCGSRTTPQSTTPTRTIPHQDNSPLGQLPSRTNQTGLPVHVHGSFGINSDRHSLKWPGPDQTSEPAKWNKLLVKELLPRVYVSAIKCAINMQINGQEISIDCIYHAWPDLDHVMKN